MKLPLIAAAVCIAAAGFAAPTFKISFPEKKFVPQAKSKMIVSKATISDDNFTPGPDGKFAFVLSEKNVAEKKTPVFSASVNFPFAAGSAEVTFKALQTEPGKQYRMLHVFAPGKGQPQPKNLLIYYMYVDIKGDIRAGIQIENKQFLNTIPAKEMKANDYNTLKMTWNATAFTLFLNGKKMLERPLPPEFAKIAATPRGWSTLAILPVYPPHDSWKSRVAISSIDIQSAK